MNESVTLAIPPSKGPYEKMSSQSMNQIQRMSPRHLCWTTVHQQLAYVKLDPQERAGLCSRSCWHHMRRRFCHTCTPRLWVRHVSSTVSCPSRQLAYTLLRMTGDAFWTVCALSNPMQRYIRCTIKISIQFCVTKWSALSTCERMRIRYPNHVYAIQIVYFSRHRLWFDFF